MRRKYAISDKEFWIEIISFSDLEYHPISAKPISATELKKYIQSRNYVREVFITSTLPNVYVQAGKSLFMISYRPFLSFVSNLYEVEEFVKLNWLVDGF